MAESVGLAGSIIAVLQITETVVSYLKDVKDASPERYRLQAELPSIQVLLQHLKARCDEGQVDSTILQLKVSGGPLEQLQNVLEGLEKKLQAPARKSHEFGRALMWHFDKADVAAMLTRIERLKATFIAALANDQYTLSRLMLEDVRHLRLRVDDIQKNVNNLKLSVDRVQDIASGVKIAQIAHRVETATHIATVNSFVDDYKLDNIHSWLAAPEPSANWRAAMKLRQPGTGAWLIDSLAFKQWQATVGSFIWLHGKPGCGKSVMSATIIQDTLSHCSNKPESVLAYFYFDFNDQAKQDCTKFLASLIIQLTSASSKPCNDLFELYTQHGKGQSGSKPTSDALLRVLANRLTAFKHVYIVVDALDECKTSDELLDWISNTLSSVIMKQYVHLLVLSRRERDIEEAFEPFMDKTSARRRISMDGAHVDEDIRTYIQAVLRRDGKFKKWSNIHAHIEMRLMQKANGMFRWAYCQLDALRKCLREHDVYTVLEALPNTLEETYARILQDIDRGMHAQDAFKILKWLCFSFEPLRLDELIDIIAIENDEPYKLNPSLRLFEPRDILSICPNLITIVYRKQGLREPQDYYYTSFPQDDLDYQFTGPNSELVEEDLSSVHNLDDNTFYINSTGKTLRVERSKIVQEVRLAHSSVQEYLRVNRHGNIYSMDIRLDCAMIATDCLHYLLDLGEPLQYLHDSKGCDRLLQARPAAIHCAENLWFYLKTTDSTGGATEVNSLACRAMMTPAFLTYLLWLEMIGYRAGWEDSKDKAQDEDQLNRRAFYQADLIDVQEIASNPATGLFWAVNHRLLGLACALLESGIDANAACWPQGTLALVSRFGLSVPLHCASYLGHLPMVQLLVEHGARIDRVGYKFSSALHAAADGGNLEVVKYFLGLQVNIDHHVRSNLPRGRLSDDGMTPLQVALHAGRSKVAAYLIHRGARCRQALAYSIWTKSQDAELTKLLLDNGACPDDRDASGRSALHWATVLRRTDSIKHLLDMGADIDIRDGDGNTALISSALNGYDDISSLLLDRGADVNASNKGKTPLYTAALAGKTDTVKLLLGRGANLYNREQNSGSAPVRILRFCPEVFEAQYQGMAGLLVRRGAGDVPAFGRRQSWPLRHVPAETLLPPWRSGAPTTHLCAAGEFIGETELCDPRSQAFGPGLEVRRYSV